MEILAHRGDSARLTENTLPALRAALPGGPAGADGLELDLRLDAAGRPRVFHDEDTGRLTGVPGAFAAHPIAVLDDLRVGGEPIPHLAEICALVRSASAPLTLAVELKPTPTPERLVAACRPHLDALLRAAPQVDLVVSSFDPRLLYAVRRQGLAWRLAYLYDDPLALSALPVIEHAGPPGPVDLHPRHDLATAHHLSEYRRAGRAFRCWTVDEAPEAARLAALGVDAVITNRPRFLRDALAQM